MTAVDGTAKHLHEGTPATRAQVGDMIRTRPQWDSAAGQHGQVMETLSRHGAAYYRVRWDDGFESIYFAEGDVDIISRRRF